jgi:histidine ammonia-lyase
LNSVLAGGQAHYGINTGFGALGRVRIDEDSLQQLQLNLIRSHSTGVGAPLAVDKVRATMTLLVASLCRGYSGVRREVVQLLVALLNAGITPEIPETGSVGASGDLAPLAHLSLVLIGEGFAFVDGRRLRGADALAGAQLKPISLQAKEGLALINGTHLMAGQAALLVEDFQRLFEAALAAAAMSVDSCRATDATLDERVHQVRHQAGQIYVAGRLREMLSGSQIVKSHLENDPRVQDPYSFRCCPAVLGAAWDAFGYVRARVHDELGAVSDNPLVFPASDGGGDIVAGGNFHGMPVALPLDMLAIATSHVAGIAERRVFHMLSGADNEAELPSFLTPQAGLQSGLMIAQYTAAACCNELIGLSNPASVANLSTSAGMEDYNSFGPRSAAKARRGLRLARSVIAIELLCATAGLDHHRPLRSGDLVERAYDLIRENVKPLTQDRSPAPDIGAIETMIQAGRFVF